jgi:acyl-CoA synthetase (NDP forming)
VTETPAARLGRALAPTSVAVVGASPRTGSLSLRFLTGLERHGFGGRIVAVNPSYDEVGGFPCVPTVAAAGPLDLAVLAVSKTRVLESLEACAEAGVAGAVVFASGYSETGPEGRVEEQRIGELARRTGLRVIGPNSPGLVNLTRRCCVIASGVSFRETLHAGGVAVVSQSGGVAGLLTERAQDAGVGLSAVVCTGNESDVGIGEVLEALAADDATRAVALFVEGVRDGGGFVRGLDELRRAGKHAVVLKTGATEGAARASAAHTGALVTDADVFRAVLERTGAHAAASLDDLLVTASVLERLGPAPSRRIGIVTTSGGAGVVATEAAERAGLELPALSETTREALVAAMPDFASPANPTDTSGMFVERAEIFRDALGAFLGADELDAVVLVLTVQPPELALELAERMLALAGDGAPLVCLWVAGAMSEAARERLRAGGVPVVDDPDRCMRALAARAAAGATSPAARTVAPVGVPAVLDEGRARGAALEHEVLAAAAELGAATAATRPCASAAEARAAAEALGAPVVVKAAARDLPHKAAVGAVRLGVDGGEACTAAFAEVVAAARAAGATVEGAVVQAQVPPGAVVIVGARRDPVFGPVLVVGPGGAGVEELGTEAVRRLLPLAEGEAETLAAGLGGAKALAAAIESVERLALALGDELEALELNPVVLGGDGAATAVDGVLLLRGYAGA